MAVEGLLLGLSLFAQTAQLAAQIESLRRQDQDTSDTEELLVDRLIDLFSELSFCQDVRDATQQFHSRVRLAVFRQGAQATVAPQQIADAVEKWFTINIVDNLGVLIPDRHRANQTPIDFTDIQDLQLRDAIQKAAKSYYSMIEQTDQFLRELPTKLELLRRSGLTIQDFAVTTLKNLEDIHDYQLASVSALIRLGSLMAHLIRRSLS